MRDRLTQPTTRHPPGASGASSQSRRPIDPTSKALQHAVTRVADLLPGHELGDGIGRPLDLIATASAPSGHRRAPELRSPERVIAIPKKRDLFSRPTKRPLPEPGIGEVR